MLDTGAGRDSRFSAGYRGGVESVAASDFGLRHRFTVDANRPLDEDELALVDALRDCVVEASVTTEWRDVGADSAWPIFVLRPETGTGIESHWWMSAEPQSRRDDLVVAEFALADFSEGILGRIGASETRCLVEAVARFASALAEGRATYKATKADPQLYDDPIAGEALDVSIDWTYRTEHRTGSAVVRAYLGDPDAFAGFTGIPIAA